MVTMVTIMAPITLIQLEIVSVNFSDLHLPTVSGTNLIATHGDSWVIPVDNDTLMPGQVEKLTDMEDRFTESKPIRSSMRDPYNFYSNL
jgi:hypothetical protein